MGGTAGQLEALVVTEFGPPGGPGLGGIVVLQVQTPVPTPDPNNDNASPSRNVITLPGLCCDAKPFGALASIDIVFQLQESGGSTEYFFTEVVRNSTGAPWGDFHFELGLGTRDTFARFSQIAFFRPTVVPDFDTPDRDPAPASSVFTHLQHEPDALAWTRGSVPPGATVQFTFSFDAPDDPLGSLTQFTLRQRPTAVPAPSPLLLVAAGLLATAAMLRPRTRPTATHPKYNASPLSTVPETSILYISCSPPLSRTSRPRDP